MGFVFSDGQVERCKDNTMTPLLCLAEFETPINCYSDINFNAAFSTGLLKSSKYLYVLPTYMKTFLDFYFEQLQSVSLAIPPFRFRIADISFYNKKLHWF